MQTAVHMLCRDQWGLGRNVRIIQETHCSPPTAAGHRVELGGLPSKWCSGRRSVLHCNTDTASRNFRGHGDCDPAVVWSRGDMDPGTLCQGACRRSGTQRATYLPPPLVLPHPGKTVARPPLGDGCQVTVPTPPWGNALPPDTHIQHKMRSKGCQCTEIYCLTCSV